MRLVADCSIVTALCLGEDAPQFRASIDAFRAVMMTATVFVPSLWPTELANAIVNAERRHRVEPSDRDRLVEDGFAMSPVVEEALDRDGLLRLMALATRHGLTVYDALYVDLALRTGSVLASLDGAMLRAARKEGIAVLGDPA